MADDVQGRFPVHLRKLLIPNSRGISMSDYQHKVDTTGIAVGGTLATLTAITLNQWVAIVTLVYFTFQCIIALPKMLDALKTMWGRYGWKHK